MDTEKPIDINRIISFIFIWGGIIIMTVRNVKKKK